MRYRRNRYTDRSYITLNKKNLVTKHSALTLRIECGKSTQEWILCVDNTRNYLTFKITFYFTFWINKVFKFTSISLYYVSITLHTTKKIYFFGLYIESRLWQGRQRKPQGPQKLSIRTLHFTLSALWAFGVLLNKII